MTPSVKERLLQWATDQEQLDTVSSFLLYRLAQFADADCCAWAQIATLAKAVRVSERTVQYRLRELEAEGLIKQSGRTHRLTGSTRSVPIYQLAPEINGLGARPDQTQSMGAKSAPIDAGAKAMGAKSARYGCKGAAPANELKEPKSESSLALRAREASPVDRSGGETPPVAADSLDEAMAAYPDSGLARTNHPAARAEWARIIGEMGIEPARLCEAVRRARPMLDLGDYGAPAFDRWLAEERWRAHLPGVNWRPAAHGVRAAFAGPEDFRAAFVAAHGEATAGAWLDRAGWDAALRALTPANGVAFDWLGRNAGGLLRQFNIRLQEPGRTGVS